MIASSSHIFDHIVYFTNNLKTTTTLFKSLGFNVKPGGKHPFGTFNNLIYFADGSYLELVSYQGGMHRLLERKQQLERNQLRNVPEGTKPQVERLETRWARRDFSEEEIVDFCIMMPESSQQKHLHELQQGEHPVMMSIPGSRKTSESQETPQIQWRLTIETKPHDTVEYPRTPFIIQDVTNRDLRVLPVTNEEHPNGCRGIEKLVYPVSNLSETLQVYDSLLQWKPVQQSDTDAIFQTKNGQLHLEEMQNGSDQVMQRPRLYLNGSKDTWNRMLQEAAISPSEFPVEMV